MPFRRFVTGGISDSGGGGAGGLGTGVFTRNCVLSGKRWDEFGVPAYVKLRNVITTFPSHENLLGAMSSASGTASGALPRPRPAAITSVYCELASANDWIQYAHPYRTVTADGYTFMTHSDYAPNGWEFQGSNDGSNWTTLDTVDYSGETWTIGVNLYHGTIDEGSRGSYTYHRIVFTSFVGSTVRIYHFQFYDSDVTSTGHVYIDADATDPLKIAFADGYEGGLPKDIIVTLPSPVQNDFESDLNLLGGSLLGLINGNTAVAHLFAVYDSGTDMVSYELEPVYENPTYPVDLATYGKVLETGDDFDSSLDLDWNTFTHIEATTREGIYTFSQPFLTDQFTFKVWFERAYTNPNPFSSFTVTISEDGETFKQVAAYAPSTAGGYTGLGIGTHTVTVYLDRVYSVKKLGISAYSYGAAYKIQLYEVQLNDATKTWKRKFQNGKYMQYNTISEEWEQAYRVPLGTVDIWRNVDDDGWELASFTPTHIPEMLIAPWYRRTIA